MKKIGILTGGGDCPGLNAVIRAVVRRAIGAYNLEVLGIREGWGGLIYGYVEPLTHYSITGILPRGGTILGTSRKNPLKSQDDHQRLRDNLKRYGIDALIAVGGEDTLGVAYKLHKEGVPLVGVPKTIDNDLSGTDYTFGFDTAVSIATEAIDRLHTTAESHNRVIVVEVMGRHTGWIATVSGIAGGADCILIPERSFKVLDVSQLIKTRHKRGKTFSIVVVAEGAKPEDTGDLIVQDEKVDEFGHVRLGGIGSVIARQIEEQTGIETRVTALGYVQRGGTPTAYDRVLATRFGVKAVDMIIAGEFGKMASLRGNKVVSVDLEEATSGIKKVDPELFRVAEVFFG
jgi:6-phosphofructokinase 1